MKTASRIPAISEPFFLAPNARVEIQPIMTAEDPLAAAPAIEAAVEKYG